jgi:hypothetical protein
MGPRLPRALRRSVDLSSHSRPPAPFVVGVTRSGTTLLRLMLDAHPELTIPPETHFVPKVIRRAADDDPQPKRIHRAFVETRRWGDFGLDEAELLRRLKRLDPLDPTSAVRCFYDFYAESQDKPRWGDKTPGYQVKMRRIKRALPEARFIHVIRDGRDVVLSQWRKAENPTPIEDAAKRWKQRVSLSRKLGSKMGDGYTELRYEDLIANPEASLRRLCDFVELDFDSAVLQHHERATERLEEIAKDLPGSGSTRELSAEERMKAHELAVRPLTTERLEVWRRDMSSADVALFETIAGDTLAELGYARGPGD